MNYVLFHSFSTASTLPLQLEPLFHCFQAKALPNLTLSFNQTQSTIFIHTLLQQSIKSLALKIKFK